MTILSVHIYIDPIYLLCVCVTVKIQFDNTSTHHTRPLLGHCARSRVWAPRIQKFWIRPCWLFQCYIGVGCVLLCNKVKRNRQKFLVTYVA